jgi:hypothetical protein
VHAEQKAAAEAAVAVTRMRPLFPAFPPSWVCGLAGLFALYSLHAAAAILPEERADAMYHSYDGGGVTIDGPSVLVRKNFAETVSASANYYVDNVTSASIDVITSGASEYGEKRTEFSLGADYLYDKSIFSAGYTNSEENDYTADTWYFNVSQDFFGDLSNLSFSYARGDDEVRQNGNDDFAEDIVRNSYRLGFSQVLRPNLIMALNYEAITDEGYLNNPYRSYRYLTDPLDEDAGYQLAQEVYPDTRTSDAASMRMLYYFPWRATMGVNYRYFSDDWGIDAHTVQFSYTHTFRDRWILDAKYRYYEQGASDFYGDLFLTPSQDEKDYRARDKELSQFSSNSVSLHLSYELPVRNRLMDRSAISLQWDKIYFDYEDFSDLTDITAPPGQERLYEFNADVVKLLLTVWY